MNRGSATLKAALYEVGDHEKAVLSVKVDRADSSSSHVTIADSKGAPLFGASVDPRQPDSALEEIFQWLGQQGYLSTLAAAGHRLVHGGSQFKKPLKITPEVLAELEELVPLDPDHLPEAMAGIRFIAQKLPE